MDKNELAQIVRELFADKIDMNTCSIEFKMSAKGERYWDIKQYHEPGKELEAISTIKMVDDKMKELFS